MAAHLLRVRPFLSLAPDAQSPHRAHDRDLVPGIAASRRLDAAISSLVVIALDIKLLGERITILFNKTKFVGATTPVTSYHVPESSRWGQNTCSPSIL